MLKKRKKKVASKKVTYDKAAQAMYITLVDSSEKVASTKEDNLLVLVDRDSRDNILGIEIIGIKL